MADEKTKDTKSPDAGSKTTNTGAPSVDRKAARSDATDPLQAPAMDASPERFLAEKPDHIARMGDDAPPVPGAIDEMQRKTEEAKGKRLHRLTPMSGWFDGHTHHPAGAQVMLTPEQETLLRSRGLLDEPAPKAGRQAGEPLGTDEAEAARVTTEARGQRTR